MSCFSSSLAVEGPQASTEGSPWKWWFRHFLWSLHRQTCGSFRQSGLCDFTFTPCYLCFILHLGWSYSMRCAMRRSSIGFPAIPHRLPVPSPACFQERACIPTSQKPAIKIPNVILFYPMTLLPVASRGGGKQDRGPRPCWGRSGGLSV